MDHPDTLQARRQQAALKNRSKGPGGVASTNTGFGLAQSTSSSGFLPASGSGTPMWAPKDNSSPTAVSFGAPLGQTPTNTPTTGKPSNTTQLNFNAQPRPVNTPPEQTGTPHTPGSTQTQMTNAQKIQAQLSQYGIVDMVMPSGMDNVQKKKEKVALPTENPNALVGSDAEHMQRNKGAMATIPATPKELLKYVPRHGLLQCYIKREKAFGFGGGSKYRLYLQKDDRFVCSARKRANKPTSNYLVSCSEHDLERSSANFFGKVRANFTGLEFMIYDHGEAPESGNSPIRTEFGAVCFEQNIGGVKGPRKMKVLLPLLNDEDEPQAWQPMKDDESILAEYKRDPTSPKFLTLQNKAPTWNEQLRAYQLNFHGRVTQASVKNFQLCDARHPSRVVLQFGKCDDNKFTLDYQYPLTAFQAFSIAMTSFDNKLACD